MLCFVSPSRRFAPRSPSQSCDLERGKCIVPNVHRRLDSLRQLFNRLAEGLTELVHLSSLHSPIKGLKYVSASQSKLNKVSFVEH